MTASIRYLLVASGFVALLMLALAGPSYRLDLLSLGAAFTLLRWAAYLGLASLVLIITYSVWQRPPRRWALPLILSAFAGLIAVYLPFAQWQQARSAPPIHDISTDLENPPEFDAIRPLRADAPNPPEYAGEETARQQRQAYPDIKTLILDEPFSRVYPTALRITESLNWQRVSTKKEQDWAQIEATDTTFWFGFKDDVIIRLRSLDEDQTQVDLRSKSRIGKGDVGTNAKRIREFNQALVKALGADESDGVTEG